jgi:hypothetical protein
MTPSSSVSDVDFFPDDVNPHALLHHRTCRCFRAAALFEEDTHALKIVTSSVSSRAFLPPVVASTIVCEFARSL